MEREVGGGIWMGNTCKPMAVSFQCMTKFTTNKKKKERKKKKRRTLPQEVGSSWDLEVDLARVLEEEHRPWPGGEPV